MGQSRIIELLLHNGESVKGRLSSPFRPMEQKVSIVDDAGQSKVLLLSQVMYILFHDSAQKQPSPHLPGEVNERIETMDGAVFHVRVLNQQDFSFGFFAISTDVEYEHERIFFTWHGVHNRQELRHLGEILRDEGILPEPVIEKALKEQEKLRSQRVGDILAEKHGVPHQSINKLEQTRKESPATAKMPIGEILVSAHLITREQLENALGEQRKSHNLPLGDMLVKKGLITEEQLLMALALKFRLRFLDLRDISPSDEVLQMIPADLAQRFKIFPIRMDEHRLVVATSEPTNSNIPDMLRFRTNHRIELVVASPDQIQTMIQKYYHAEAGDVADLSQLAIEFSVMDDDDEGQKSDYELQNEAEKAPIIRLANKILLDGVMESASDIHVLPVEHGLKVSYRINGQLRQHLMLDRRIHRTLVTRLKIIAGMNIAEHRLPQDGRVLMSAGGRDVELRVSCMPGQYGENIVFRVLSRQGQSLDLNNLGFEDEDRERIRRITHGAHGILLVTGPTGSGKSTTLLAAMKDLTGQPKHLISLEDPIEAKIAGVNQIQIHEHIGFSFASALRNVLRHDPDVIMVGEIRDPETAQISIQASLTGHTLLSSLHTNHAVGAFSRLINMGAEPYLVAATVKGVLSQHLIPKLCAECRSEAEADAQAVKYLQMHGISWPKATSYIAPGCNHCNGTGIAGRLLVYELLTVDEEIQRLVTQHAPDERLFEAARKQGMITMAERGVAMAERGDTALEHVIPLLVE